MHQLDKGAKPKRNLFSEAHFTLSARKFARPKLGARAGREFGVGSSLPFGNRKFEASISRVFAHTLFPQTLTFVLRWKIKEMAKKRFPIAMIILAVLTLITVSQTALSQDAAGPQAMSQPEIDRIVKAFTAKEAEFRKALNIYSFKRDAMIQTLGMGGQVTGEYRRVSSFTFDDQGNRFEKISFFPMPSYGGITPEDLEDLGGISPFALEPSKIDKYNIKYAGKEKIDELNLYVFDVTPKVIPDPKKIKERLFSGRVWVDDQELQIVKAKGKGLPETKVNKFPIVETYGEQFGGHDWFPTYAYADEELIFDSGEALHIRMKVRYTDFAPARADVKVIEVDGSELPNQEVKPPPAKPKP